MITLHANDLDDSDAGRVTYSIVSGDGVGVFSVDADTGVLSVVTALDYETKNSYAYVLRFFKCPCVLFAICSLCVGFFGLFVT